MNQIRFGALISYISIAINMLIGIVYTPWMINSIGKESYGLYILATSVITLFMFDFGLGSAVTRFISKYIAENRHKKINDFLGQIVKLYIGIDVILLIVLISVYFFIPSIYKELTSGEVEQFKIVYTVVACYSVISFPFIPLDGIITAYEKFVQLKLCDLFHKIFIVVTMACCLLAGYGLLALVLVNAIAGIFTILLKLVVIRRNTNVNPNLLYSNKQEFKEVAGYSSWVTIGALAQRLIFNIAPTILGAVSGSVEIALFGIAATFEGYVFTFANALNGLFLPSVTKIAYHNKESLNELMIKVGRIQIFIIGLLVLGFILVGNDFITLWLGTGYEMVYKCAVFLIIPSFFYLPQLIGSNAVLAMNKVKKQATVFVYMGLFNLIFGALLAVKFGALGFSVSVFLAYTIRTIGMDLIFHKDLQLDIKSFFKKTFLSMSPVLFSVFLLSTLITHVIVEVSWLTLLIEAMLITMIYCLGFFLFSFSKKERDMFFQPLLKLLNR